MYGLSKLVGLKKEEEKSKQKKWLISHTSARTCVTRYCGIFFNPSRFVTLLPFKLDPFFLGTFKQAPLASLCFVFNGKNAQFEPGHLFLRLLLDIGEKSSSASDTIVQRKPSVAAHGTPLSRFWAIKRCLTDIFAVSHNFYSCCSFD